MRVPDLWRTESANDVTKLYEIAMSALAPRPDERVALCRRVRRHAAAHGNARLLASTLVHEIEALFALRRGMPAWRQLRRLEKEIAARASDPWFRDNARRVAELRAPILYLRERHEEAAAALEAMLGERLRASSSSFAVLARVVNDDVEPRSVHRVTLQHVYARLGRGLETWSDWPRFVLGLHERLLAMAGLSRDALLWDPTLLADLAAVLDEERRSRVLSGVARGERDLVEDAAEVRRWHEEKAAELHAFRQRTAARRARLAHKLRAYFPFLEAR